MKKTLIAALAATLSMAANIGFTATKHVNPFAAPSALPLEAPPFDKIKDTDYQPAFIEGMKQQMQEINQIANNPEAPTFANTIEAMEKSGRMLGRVSETFFAVVQANTNPTLDKIQSDITPKLAAHHDAISLNSKLFARIKAIYDQRESLHLDPEAKYLIEIYYQQFVHAGANLNAVDKEKLKQLNKKMASLETAYQQKLVAANKNGALTVKDKNELAGLNDDELAAMAVNKGKTKQYVIPLQNTTQQPLLQSLQNRDTRQKLFEQSWNRAELGDKNDTRNIITQLAQLRAQKAALFGYDNFASYTLYDQMAKTPQAVHEFLGQLTPAVSARITDDSKQLQAMIDKANHVELKPWDWNYYSEQVRKMKYNLDQAQVKPYFELNNVLQNGVFYAANQMYGLTFKERHDLPVYHPDVRVFDVHDKDGSLLGLLYLDYFQRDNKTGGAWMSNFVQQSTLLQNKPVVYNVTNFTKPAKGAPALLSFDDVTAMFHEFGHALHGLFMNNKYPTTNSDIARDFVEFPSQFNEHWALYPQVLKHYAVHYKTGAPMPQELIEKIQAARTFNQGYMLGELLAASELDMKWHELPANAGKLDVDTFEQQAWKDTHTDFAAVPSRYRSTYFLHIWANGYSAGYYAYLWSEMLDHNAYYWFIDNGGMTRENGQRLRDMVLSRGHSEDYGTMFKAFYGKDPTIAPMLKYRGFDSTHE